MLLLRRNKTENSSTLWLIPRQNADQMNWWDWFIISSLVYYVNWTKNIILSLKLSVLNDKTDNPGDRSDLRAQPPPWASSTNLRVRWPQLAKNDTRGLISCRGNKKLLDHVKVFSGCWRMWRRCGLKSARARRGPSLSKAGYVSKMFLHRDSVIVVLRNPLIADKQGLPPCWQN